MCGPWDNKNKVSGGKLTEPSLTEGKGFLDTRSETALDTLLKKGVPYLAKKWVEARRYIYYALEALRDPKLQKKVIDYGTKKVKPVIQKVRSELLDQTKNTRHTVLTWTVRVCSCVEVLPG